MRSGIGTYSIAVAPIPPKNASRLRIFQLERGSPLHSCARRRVRALGDQVSDNRLRVHEQ